jgi:hypothetical protein
MHAPAPVNRQKVWQEKLTRSGYFFGAILLHLVVFLLVSTLVIWTAGGGPPVEFQAISTAVVKPPPPPPTPANTGTAAANPDMDPQNVVVPPVSLPTAITTANLSSSTVDPAKSLNATLSNLSDLLPQGSGSGPAGSGTDSGKNGFWGQLEQGTSTGLEGTFYDFTRTQDGKGTGMTGDTYAQVVKAFCKDFTPPDKYPCYKSSVHLASKFFFFPPIPDSQAGQAFQTPSSTEAFWIAHYHGSFTVESHGRYRLVGFGDNVLEVSINNQVVLDASDIGVLGLPRTREGDGALLPGKGVPTPVFMGDSFEVEPGVPIHIDIAVGDEGGIFCAGLFLAPDNPSITFNTNGTPKLPLMFFGTLAEADKQTLLQFLAPECVTSPVTFTVVPETSTNL